MVQEIFGLSAEKAVKHIYRQLKQADFTVYVIGFHDVAKSSVK